MELDFMLAADIIHSIHKPDLQELYVLAMIRRAKKRLKMIRQPNPIYERTTKISISDCFIFAVFILSVNRPT